MTKGSNGRTSTRESPDAVQTEALIVLNILLGDATAMRQCLFSYLQFYLTVQIDSTYYVYQGKGK